MPQAKPVNIIWFRAKRSSNPALRDAPQTKWSSDAVESEGKMKQTQRGKVLAVNISEKKGTKKTNIQSCLIVKEYGLKGDAHAGPWHRQVSLLANESIQKIKAKGLNVGYGDFAENITTEGLDLVHLPIGTEMRIGNSVLLCVTQIGKKCHQRCAIYYQAGDCVMPKEGIFAEVIKEGEVKVGDEIIVG